MTAVFTSPQARTLLRNKIWQLGSQQLVKCPWKLQLLLVHLMLESKLLPVIAIYFLDSYDPNHPISHENPMLTSGHGTEHLDTFGFNFPHHRIVNSSIGKNPGTYLDGAGENEN